MVTVVVYSNNIAPMKLLSFYELNKIDFGSKFFDEEQNSVRGMIAIVEIILIFY